MVMNYEAPVIDIQGLHKRYGTVQALNGLDLAVNEGEIFGYLGPNGAGKSTTINIVLGFIKATSGAVRAFGLDPQADGAAVRRRIGFLPESPRLYEDMTGIEFLEYVGRLQTGGDAPDWKPYCERLDLGPAALARKIKGYSNGMKQKIALVQALQHQPSLLILDEPTSALDPISQQPFFDLLRDARAGGATILFSSHNLWEVEQLCHRVAIVRQGRVVESGRVDELQERRARIVEVVFRNGGPEELDVPGAQVVSRNGARWHLSVRGDPNAIVRALAQYDLDDFVMEHPRLEDIFMDYYQQQPEEESGEAS